MNDYLLETTELTKIYKSKAGNVRALSDISLQFPKQGLIFINGISGSGKTTLMNLLAGIDKPTSGTITYDGKDITHYSDKELSDYRNLDIGIVFQNFNLIEDMTVKQNLNLPLSIQEIEEKESEKIIEDTLCFVGLKGFQNRKCNELSAGQRQRVAIARALIKNPRIIFADEAMGNLDPLNAEAMLQLFNSIAEERLVILISHDKIAADNYGSRIITLSEGKVINDVDNSQIKNLSNIPYHVSVKNNEAEYDISLNDFDLKREITKTAKWNGSFFEKINLNLQIEHTQDSGQQKDQPICMKREKGRKTPLPLKDIIRNAMYPIKKKGMQTLMIILLIAFVCTLFHLAFIIKNNDYEKAIAKYITGAGYDMVPVEQLYITKDEQKMKIFKGKIFLDMLSDTINAQPVKNVPQDSTIAGSHIYAEMLYAESFEAFKVMNIEGSWPSSDEEIVICKEIAEQRGARIGDTVVINEIKCRISGICTGKIGGYIQSFIIAPQFVADAAFKDVDHISIEAVDVTISVDVPSYAYEWNSIGMLSHLNQPLFLWWGRKPEAPNEILISDKLAKSLGDEELEGDLIKSYRLPDLYDVKYGGQYTGRINLIQYTGKKVEIVGIYDTETDPEYANIVFCDEVYESLMRDYSRYLGHQKTLIPTGANLYENIKKLSALNIQISDEDICAKMYSYKESTESLKNTLTIIQSVIAAMIVFLMVAFLAYNVKDQARRIGVFRVVGVGRKSIEIIYLINSLLISILSVALSCGATMILVKSINAYLSRYAHLSGIDSYDTLLINYPGLFGRTGLIVLAGLIVTILPLKVMFGKRTILLLNSEH